MPNVIKSKSKDPVKVLDSFIKSLDEFIKLSINNIQQMSRRHQDMANSWSGDQYNSLTLVLENMIRDATNELKELNILKQELVKRRNLYAAGKEIKYDK